ncbi:MAG: aldo/keto reductase [Lachnospiraceae bacterium]|nr:aldo/keto reductase [Lachnospiraceae bacterium]
MKEVVLNNGVKIPIIGFGTYKSTIDEGYRVVSDAIKAGYRHLDTAALYENEEEVGTAVAESGIARSEFFITSKLRRNSLGYESTKRELEESLRKLKTDYLDLYLIHWPRSDYGRGDYDDWKEQDRESWRAMEEMVKDGRIRAIGVSNFLPHHLDNLLKTAEIVPAVNQLELHPGYLQKEAVEYSRSKGIEIEAWSPIGRARLMDNPLLKEIAAKYDISVAKLCLSFCLQSGFIIIPKSTHFERMQENLKVRDDLLSEEDMRTIREMPEAGWSGEHPDRETVAV